MAAKTICWYCTIMLIYANWRENDGVDLFLFFYFLFYLFIYLFVFLRQKKRIR